MFLNKKSEKISSKYLVGKYLKLPAQDLELNAKLKQEEIEELNLAGDPDRTPEDGSNESLEDIIPNITEDLKERIKKAVLKKKRKKKRPTKNDNDDPEEE